ncbi:MAG: orotidine-5'-phosphate decarboxylase [Candidatus Tectomicrobia bacterium]|uniref:Orotidine 5'-phosphate decarboxylase n=1 Tax=Tectimicrobiota bacterium TaxID=2528274 RepID=A0A933GKR1_UNCTE|nr:orotidine-5'-phosphate decarboxylase [Candidatus Tectomicrobia bacterium]
MEHFCDRLISLIKIKGSHIVVGIDPQIDQIPQHILKAHQEKFGYTPRGFACGLLDFGKNIIDAVFPHTPAVKIQIAYYEYWGYWGIWAFQETAKYAKERGLLVIGDVKRADISSTAQTYAEGYLESEKHVSGLSLESREDASYFLDALTLNPYLGSDSLLPFLKLAHETGKGAFILVKTSNPSSAELQDLQTPNGKIYELMAEKVNSWGETSMGFKGYSSVGAVVGATYPKVAERLRALMPHTYFLVPGYGAQGAKGDDLAPFFNTDGLGAVVNSSRGIIFAYKQEPYRRQFEDKDFASAASLAAVKMKEEINAIVGLKGGSN